MRQAGFSSWEQLCKHAHWIAIKVDSAIIIGYWIWDWMLMDTEKNVTVQQYMLAVT